ncbi:hypothetical protein EC9_03760 [Rosistilla ulvae]|uniref:Uncharacterized protein n=1 Tax=Rosistilla ulvae TaxID=1930277 RepID=A0A517LUC4_9BACT|nr:DUF5989 family protein [Rosistilla ulvae]QDS86216.1 hypothetical protein EC9_03760 [Rosistilla ulvae]
MEDQDDDKFAEMANASHEQSFLSELVEFLRFNKKWWLAPILVALLLLGALLLLSGTAAAPFIYTLF